MERREFLKRTGRMGLWGGLIALGGVFVLKQQVSLKSCQLEGICKDCSKLKKCKLPAAIKLKEDGQK